MLRMPSRRERVLLAIAAALGLMLALRVIGLTVVRGNSTAPTLRDGQVCVYSRLARPQAGSLVLAWDGGDLLVHRVVYLSDGDDGRPLYTLAGDCGAHCCEVGRADRGHGDLAQDPGHRDDARRHAEEGAVKKGPSAKSRPWAIVDSKGHILGRSTTKAKAEASAAIRRGAAHGFKPTGKRR